MVRELQSPLSTHLLNRLRSAQTDATAFRMLVRELTLLLANEAFSASDLHMEPLLTWQGEASYALLREEGDRLCDDFACGAADA